MYKIERPHLNKDRAENVADRLNGNQINKVINFSHKSVTGINGSASATPQDQEQMRPVGSDVIEAFFRRQGKTEAVRTCSEARRAEAVEM